MFIRDEILTLVALLSGEGVMQSASSNRNEALLAQTKFHSEFGDHETLLNIYTAYTASKNKKVSVYIFPLKNLKI